MKFLCKRSLWFVSFENTGALTSRSPSNGEKSVQEFIKGRRYELMPALGHLVFYVVAEGESGKKYVVYRSNPEIGIQEEFIVNSFDLAGIGEITGHWHS
jgi:hypothetical protein